MRVTICGPNLNDQTRGTFHVHAEGCGDLTKYGPGRKYGGEERGEREMTVEADTRVDVVWAVYADHLEEGYDEDERDATAERWVSDFHFAPCVRLKGR